MSEAPLLCLYAVQNAQGQFFHAKGYSGHGETWVDDIRKARIYARPGPARAQVTYFATNYPDHPMPQLVELWVTRVRSLDEVGRVHKAQMDKKRADVHRRHEDNKEALRQAKEELGQTQAEILALEKELNNFPSKGN